LKFLDDVPYAILGAFFAAVTFFLGNLVFYQFLWQLALAPIMGALLGFLAGVQVVRSKKLRVFATMREHRIAIADHTTS
jgi:ABC-type branched-subunit amino acid transport system permease subunit